jgi:hypothetical protein
MSFDVTKLLSTIEAATRVARVAVALAEDVAESFSPADQDTLRVRLMELREQNEEGFERLQAKLAKLIAEGKSGA